MTKTNYFRNDSRLGFGAFENFDVGSYATTREKALAKGVFRQAAKDLRLFQAAQDPVGQALYLDAYTWLLSGDISWPYSFINVCQLLGLPIETTRSEILIDAQSTWYSRCLRAAKRIPARFQDAVAGAFRPQSAGSQL
jgi:hypothetical protein